MRSRTGTFAAATKYGAAMELEWLPESLLRGEEALSFRRFAEGLLEALRNPPGPAGNRGDEGGGEGGGGDGGGGDEGGDAGPG